MKESEKIDKYLDLARKQKKLWNMRVTMIRIAFSALEMIQKRTKNRLGELVIRERIETIQTTILSRSTGILSKVLETWQNLLSLSLQ